MRDRHLGLKLSALTVAMFFFGFGLVPLYSIFCEVTGFGGRTSDTAEAFVGEVDTSRTVRVEFVASLGQSAPWEFRPTESSMVVHPGQLYETDYFAQNLTDRRIVGQAAPSVAPGTAAEHFKKIECFCFTQQEFAPHEGRNMRVAFALAPELPEHVDTLTLGYTFYAAE